jgi:hypothetical protein
LVLAGVLVGLCLSTAALAADANGDDEDEGPTGPNVYLDYRTAFIAAPPGVVAFGVRNLPRLQLSSQASQTVALDFPFTIDVTDRVSLWTGPSASTSRTTTTPWTPMTLDSWNVGFQADVYQQNGGWFPTVTLQSTLTRSIPETLLSATSTTSIAEFGYAFDEDETRGLLAGVQYTNTMFDSPLPKVKPAIVGCGGVQSFGGADLLTLQPIKPFTKPLLRLDLEKLDDNGNRLFGVTAEIAWVPKPVFALVLRTPLYFVKN